MRRLLLTLADDTTAAECGACRLLYSRDGDALSREPFEWRCRLYGPIVSPPGDGQFRAPACLAAERAAERMVEVPLRPGDFDHIGLDHWTTGTDDGGANDRFGDTISALRAHAEKAGER
jgi:hypothetical protein